MQNNRSILHAGVILCNKGSKIFRERAWEERSIERIRSDHGALKRALEEACVFVRVCAVHLEQTVLSVRRRLVRCENEKFAAQEGERRRSRFTHSTRIASLKEACEFARASP